MSSAPSFEKVGECLYRNPSSGTYYALVKVRGKQIKQSLKTKHLPEARRLLKEKRIELGRVSHSASKLSLAHYADLWLSSIPKSNSERFQKNRERTIRIIKESWPGGSSISARDITVPQIREFLSSKVGAKGWSHYNFVLGIVKSIFSLILENGALTEIPGIRGVKKNESVWARRKPKPPRKLVPSIDQFRAIVADIRSQEYADTREESADFVEAEGTLGLGQAEISQITRHDIDLESSTINILRVKTGQPFQVPIYPQAKELIKRRLKKAEVREDGRLFSISDPKVAVGNACKRLGFPNFTQRSFRKMFVTEALRAGVSVKIVADLQGHKDGGKLILQTYSDVVSAKERASAATVIARAYADH